MFMDFVKESLASYSQERDLLPIMFLDNKSNTDEKSFESHISKCVSWASKETYN
jgi:hypothetical protein